MIPLRSPNCGLLGRNLVICSSSVARASGQASAYRGSLSCSGLIPRCVVVTAWSVLRSASEAWPRRRTARSGSFCELVAFKEQLAGAGIDEIIAVRLEHHDVVRPLVGPVQDAVLRLGLADYPLGDVDDVVHRQFARQGSRRHRLDKGIVVAGLAQ